MFYLRSAGFLLSKAITMASFENLIRRTHTQLGWMFTLSKEQFFHFRPTIISRFSWESSPKINFVPVGTNSFLREGRSLFGWYRRSRGQARNHKSCLHLQTSDKTLRSAHTVLYIQLKRLNTKRDTDIAMKLRWLDIERDLDVTIKFR